MLPYGFGSWKRVQTHLFFSMTTGPPVRFLKLATPVKALRYRSDERAHTLLSATCTALTWRGLGESNPHRESGTRFGLRQTLDRHEHSQKTTHSRLKGRFGNRLGNSVRARCSFCGKFFNKMQDFSSSKLLLFFLKFPHFQVRICHLSG
jgi:hypothetical protein